MPFITDGYWLPGNIRQQLISQDTEYETLAYAYGRPSQLEDPDAVAARWPRFSPKQWGRLIAALHQNRLCAPTGHEFWERLCSALVKVSQAFADPTNPLRARALSALPAYTGYSEAMIRSALGALDMMSLESFPSAFSSSPNGLHTQGWGSMDGLQGRLRFYPEGAWQKVVGKLPFTSGRQLFNNPVTPNLVLGYGAGNVPGTALQIAFLAQATTLAGGQVPVVLVRNSRQEPIFSPLVLEALQAADPDLVCTTAVLVWDYEDPDLQAALLGQANLVIAAAGDEAIVSLRDHVVRYGKASPPTRFHAHGHKVSFSAIGVEMLRRGLVDPLSGGTVLDIIALLAGLDSIFWDQHGCLSSRIHFVETGGEETHTPLEYASRLNAQMRLLAEYLPRGAWPRQVLHDRFDRYKGLEVTGQVQVLSSYDDEFLVALDERPPNPATFFSLVNDCQGRVILVRPVADLMEVPEVYLRALPPQNLQSLSVAIGRPGEGLSERALRFAEACGRGGVTAIRTVGRGAFPQLAYSWDGLIPLDLVADRPRGHFTTIEFDDPHAEIMDTHMLMLRRGAQMGFEPPQT